LPVKEAPLAGPKITKKKKARSKSVLDRKDVGKVDHPLRRASLFQERIAGRE